VARILDKFPTPQTEELLSQAATLERRLEDGYRRIELAVREGKDVSAWETFWIRLLHDYEALCDGVAQFQAA
jgi:hypothetical protein